ncbi:MAG: InlB B-repeat-containing protein [Paludibacteraceae bacterium]|nr:InlB B-repeat-containing protein [Paludibacteraceae bacterium]
MSFAELTWDGNSSPWTNGSGTADDPFLIETPQQLSYLSDMVSEGMHSYADTFFLQTEDLNLNNQLWTPIGVSASSAFQGNYDGGGKYIKNIQFDGLNNNYIALFGYVMSGSISNLTVQGALTSTASKNYMAAIVASGIDVSLTNCMNKSNVPVSIRYAGGIIAYIDGGSVTRCSNIGAVSTDINILYAVSYAGGIVGNVNGNVVITQCSNTGCVSATSSSYSTYATAYAGGIVGCSSGITGCSYCFARGSVIANVLTEAGVKYARAYGIGYNINASDCYFAGTIKASYASGGISNMNSTNCYCNNDCGAFSSYSEVSRTLNQMKTETFVNQINNGQYVFRMDYSDINDGFPVLAWQQPVIYFSVRGYGIENRGTVIGGGEYVLEDTATVEAVPNSGCYFVSWSDGVTDNPRSLKVTKDTILVAIFAQMPIASIYQDCSKNGPDLASQNNNDTSENGFEMVDLGLSVYWATTNVGASSPEDRGNCFAWGEVAPKNEYTFNTYIYSGDTYNTFSKYCTDSSYGTVDNLTTLLPSDDAAYVNWGGKWRMPTKNEWDELHRQCTFSDTTLNGVSGFQVTGRNGNSIFLPFVNMVSGYSYEAGDVDVGFYWSSSLFSGNPRSAYDFRFTQGEYVSVLENIRAYGEAVRPVLPRNTRTLTLYADGCDSPAIFTYPAGESVYVNATPLENGHFVAWSDGVTDNPRSVIMTNDNSFTAIFAFNEYTVNGETHLSGDQITLTAPDSACCSFSSWSDGATANPYVFTLTKDTDITPIYTLNQFTISASATNGSVSGAGTYNCGDEVTLTATPATGYHFVAWNDNNSDNPRVMILTQDTSFTATFALNEHTVNGETHLYGDPVLLMASDSTCYTFSKWSNGATANPYVFTLTKDTVITPIYTLNRYQITWNGENGNILEQDSLDCGDMPVFSGAVPQKPATAQYTYTFSGWYPAVTEAAANTVYTAVFDTVVNRYPVSFYDFDGSLIRTDSLPYGQYPEFGSPLPSRPATPEYTYLFQSWVPALAPVTSEASYQASYAASLNSYTVLFLDADGSPLRSVDCFYGELPVFEGLQPAHPASDSCRYIFRGWSPDLQSVTEDAVYTAVFDTIVNRYPVAFYHFDGSLLFCDSLPYGQMPAFADSVPVMSESPEFVYTFRGWMPAPVPVRAAASYVALFDADVRTYPVSFYDFDGSLIAREDYRYGSYPHFDGADPVRDDTPAFSYAFTGWSPAFSVVLDTAAYVAQYDSLINSYTVSAVAEHGTVTGTGTYVYGTEVMLLALPDDGFEFSSWSDGEVANPRTIVVESDVEVEAWFVESSTSLDESESSSSVVKFIHNGSLYLFRNGHLFTVQGQLVK